VFLVPKVTKNLLSVGSITNKGCYVLFGAKKCWVLNARDPAKVLVERTKQMDYINFQFFSNKFFQIDNKFFC